jgi:anti-anti-sigma factor
MTGAPHRHAGRTNEGRLATIVSRDGIAVVGLSGELDLYVAADLRDEFDRVLAESPAGIVVDLGRVSFVDSTVLGLFLIASRRAAQARIGFALASAKPQVVRAFAACGLEGHFRIFPTVESALVEPR